MDDKMLTKVAQWGRHYFVMLLVLSQSWVQIHNDIRRNLDCMIFFSLRAKADREMLVETLACCMDKKSALSLNDSLPKHTALIIDYGSGELELYKWEVPLIKT